MIKVKYVPERDNIRVDLDFHCKEQYLTEVIALFNALTRTMEDKELFIMAVTGRLKEIEKELKEELKDDTNDSSNESDK